MTEVKRMVKYGIVGTTGTLIDLISLFILVEYLHFHVMSGAIISFILAASNNFVWNKIWTFRNKNKAYHHQYLKFLLVSTAGLGITICLMYLIHMVAGIWYIAAKMITSLIVLYWNYWGNKHWTFKPVEKKEFAAQTFSFEYSIVIPAYNEATRIIHTLSAIEKFLRTFTPRAEVIVVNDGSTDNTATVVKEFARKSDISVTCITLPHNSGKGYAVKTGIEQSNGKYILFTDADNSTPIEELQKLSTHIGSYDIVIGSRKLSDSIIEVTQPWYRKMISTVGSLLSTTLIKGIKDTQCGFKLIRHEVAQDIFSKQQIRRFGFDIEFLAIAQFYEYSILEVPIRWKDNRASRLRPIRDTFVTLRDFAIIQYNFLRKKY